MRDLTARDVMNPEVITVRDDLSVLDLAEFLTDHEISGAPVEDAEGHLVGVVSLTDIAAAFTEQRERAIRDPAEPDFYVRGWEDKLDAAELAEMRVSDVEANVAEIMTPSVFSIDEDTPVSKIAARMIHGHIHRLLVTRDRKVVGIVTTSDLLGLLVEAYSPNA